MRERRPGSGAWGHIQAWNGPGVIVGSRWTDGRLIVVSALEMAGSPVTGEPTPQWHISVSSRGRRPKPHEIRRALRALGMVGAEEDNHHPGVARHFWLPVDPAHRVGCECKAAEDTITGPDGYQWTNPKPGAGDCRGCEYEGRHGPPCPIHRPEAQP